MSTSACHFLRAKESKRPYVCDVHYVPEFRAPKIDAHRPGCVTRHQASLLLVFEVVEGRASQSSSYAHASGCYERI